MKIYINVILICLLFYRCSSSIEDKMLIGKYAFNKRGYEDTIFIYYNKEYTHIVHIQGEKYINKGTWTFNSKYLTFTGFSFYDAKGQNTHGMWISQVKRLSSNEIVLLYAEEDELYFKKID